MFSAATTTIQSENDEGDDLLELEGAKEFAVLLHPVGGLEAPSRNLIGGLLELFADGGRLV